MQPITIIDDPRTFASLAVADYFACSLDDPTIKIKLDDDHWVDALTHAVFSRASDLPGLVYPVSVPFW